METDATHLKPTPTHSPIIEYPPSPGSSFKIQFNELFKRESQDDNEIIRETVEESVPKQRNDPFSLANITEMDFKKIVDVWLPIRRDPNTFSLMLLEKLQVKCPDTMVKLNIKQGVLVDKHHIYTSDSIKQARRLMCHLDRLFLNLDKKDLIMPALSKIAGPDGFLKRDWTPGDVEGIAESFYSAAWALRVRPDTGTQSWTSLSKVLYILLSLTQDLSQWNQRTDIYSADFRAPHRLTAALEATSSSFSSPQEAAPALCADYSLVTDWNDREYKYLRDTPLDLI